MKAVCYIEPGKVKVLDMPKPKLNKPDDILVKVKYCSICGDDRRVVRGNISAATKSPPYILGHEMSGIIEEIGPAAVLKNLSVGDRVTGNYALYCGRCHYCLNGRQQMCDNVENNMETMAEYVVWSEKQLYYVPQNVSMKKACLTEPLTACIRAIETSNITMGSNVAIFGAGGTGLMLLQLARLKGAACIVIFDPNDAKRKIAVDLGADYAIDPHAENIYKSAALITKARGFESVIEASGSSDAVKPAFEIMGRGGTLVVFAVHDPEYSFPINLTQFYYKDAVIRSIFTAPNMYANALSILPLLNLDALTSHILPFTEASKAFNVEYSQDIPRILIEFY